MRPRPNSTSTRSLAPDGHLRGGGRLRPERHDLAVLGQVGDGAGLGHVHRVAPHRQPGRDDVAERDQLGDLAVEGDPQHAVVVPVGDQEPAAVGLQRVLDSGRDEERRARRIGQGERADVRDDGEAVRAVHPVDADHVAAADVGADEGDQTYAVLPMNATSIAPPMPTIARRQTAGERRDLPVFGSTREILPATPSVTYSAPPGPTVLPEPPSRPETSRSALVTAGGLATTAGASAKVVNKNRTSTTGFTNGRMSEPPQSGRRRRRTRSPTYGTALEEFLKTSTGLGLSLTSSASTGPAGASSRPLSGQFQPGNWPPQKCGVWDRRPRSAQ